jgi:hypothetical protein
MKKKVKIDVKKIKIEKIEDVTENFTEDIQCHWRIMRSPFHLNLISASYFRKKEGAKKANIYFKGLIKLFFLMRKEFKSEFKMRVYHDISTRKELYSFYEKLGIEDKKYLELFQYDVPILYDGDDGQYHRATIGTLFRFLPFFNLELHQNKDRIKISMDIDDYKMNITFLKIIKDIIKKDIYFLYYSQLSNYKINRVSCLKFLNDKEVNINKIQIKELSDDNFFYFGMAGLVYQKNELDSKLFYQFCKRFIYPISNRNKEYLIKICFFESENKKEHLQYGIDEIFLNKYIIPEQYKISDTLFKNRNEKISIIYININEIGVMVTFLLFIYKLFDVLHRKVIQDKYKPYMNLFLTYLLGMCETLKIFEKNRLYNPEKNEWKYDKLDDFLNNSSKNSSKNSNIVYDKLKDMLKNKDKMKKVKLLFKNCFSESGMYSYLVPNLKRLYDLLDSLNHPDKYLMLTYKDHKFEKEFIKYN